jgi:oligopeptidase B
MQRLPLIDRGVTLCLAHVRGGGEMGKERWYEQGGKYLTKRNTFTDFIAVAR